MCEHRPIDGLRIRALPSREGIMVLLAYVALASLSYGAFVLAPLPCAVSFLALSAYHFGREDWPEARGSTVWARGALPIAAALVGRPGASLFAEFAGMSDAAAGRVSALALVVTAASFAVLARAFVEARLGRRRAFEAALLAVGGLVLPPLASFALYFCAVHAPRGALHATRALGPRALGRSWPYVALFVGALALARPGVATSLVPHALALHAFAGLFAVTLPHVALSAWLRRRPAAGVRHS